MALFKAEDKGNCGACHPAEVGEDGTPLPLFTDFTYDDLGVPRNRQSPFYLQNPAFNPAAQDYVDIGLAKTTGRAKDKGKFKVSTLRNIVLTAPYMHNAAMQVLREVVDFYNTRDTRSDWGEPEFAENVNNEELGDLRLRDEEVEDIVAFMLTLTDGYKKD